MKKSVSVILSVIMLVSVFSVCAFAGGAEADLKIAVASDLHYNVPRTELAGPENGTIDDPIYWYANRRAAMEDESGFIIDEFLNQCASSDCEYVLISGDLADHGRSIPEEHTAVAEKLRAFEQKTGKEVFVIDGNHDCGNNSSTTVADFVSIYSEFGYDHAIDTLEGTASYTADLGEKYRLIALDSCNQDESTEDGMTVEHIEWVLAEAENAYAAGRYPILMMHHNLLDHMPLQRILSRNFIVKFHYSTAELFADAGIKVVLTGHEHCSDATSFTSGLGNTIYDFATTSLTMYPLQYRTFAFTNDEVTYEAKTVDSIDTAALTATVKGYSREQIDLMNQGLNAYAKGFLKKGVEFRLALSLTMEKLGVSEDDIYYGIVDAAVGTLTDMLEMPLYGEDSVQEMAKEYNIDIPDTEYETGWDLATDFVAAHYAGEEDKDLDSPEIKALLRTASCILKKALPAVTDELFFGAANAVLSGLGISSVSDEITKDLCEEYGGVTGVEYFIYSVASPIIYEFACDSDGVNDNHGAIEGYGSKDLGVLDNEADGFFGELIRKLQYFVHYLIRLIGIIQY